MMQFSFEFFLGGIMKPDSGVLFKVGLHGALKDLKVVLDSRIDH